MLLSLTLAAAVASAPPDWLNKPTGAALRAVWPAEAWRRGLSGITHLSCTVTVQGLVSNCKVLDETPPGAGFGQASLLLTPNFQFTPATLAGAPVPSTVVFPIRFALSGPGPPPDTGPEMRAVQWTPWLAAPSDADVAKAYPRPALAARLTGHVVLRCRITGDGALHDCATITEAPSGKGFAAAARALTSRFKARITEQDSHALWRTATFISLPIHFSPPAAEGSPRYLAQVDWVKTMDAQAVQALFPAKALQAHVKVGDARLDCAIGAIGAVEDCRVETETPSEMGFGPSAAAIAVLMQANLWTRDGQATPGARILLPIRLDLSALAPMELSAGGASAVAKDEPPRSR